MMKDEYLEENEWIEQFQKVRQELKEEMLTEDQLLDRLAWYKVEMSEVLKDAVKHVKDKARRIAGAQARWGKSPISRIKNQIKSEWLIWQKNPTGRQAGFIGDMLEKYREEVKDQKTVERWCREWKKEIASIQD
ncbi:MAG: hypothetical protein ACTHJ1_07615 [Bordetella sp.]|uniref:hypothetical protein n=1 Tax=Bordetella sp. TaxID=28081 RepID=UPI003F7CB51C